MKEKDILEIGLTRDCAELMFVILLRMNGKVAGYTTVTNTVYGTGIEGRLFYAMDTASEDGAPLFFKTYAVGINSDPIGLSPLPQYNSATRLNQEFFDMFSMLY